MNKKIIMGKIIIILIFTFTLGLFAMPQSWKSKIPLEKFSNYLLSKKIKLGLDLAGGRELDWKVDLSEIRKRNSDDDKKNDISETEVVAGVAETLRRRIDPDGTKELVIQTSSYGDEKHVIVNLTADIDNKETREKLQKRIELEFKEMKEEKSEEENAKAKEIADEKLILLKETEDFAEKAEEIANESENITFEKLEKFKDELDPSVAEKIWDKKPTEITEVIENNKGYMYAGGQLLPKSGFSIFKIIEKKSVEREKTIPPKKFSEIQEKFSENEIKEISLQELSTDLQNKVTTLKPNEISALLEDENNFFIFKLKEEATTTSDDGAVEVKVKNQTENEIENKEIKLEQIVISKNSTQLEIEIKPAVKEKFNNGSEKAKRALDSLQEKKVKNNEEQISLEELFVEVEFSPWKDTKLTGQYFRIAKVDQNQFGFPIVSIEFDSEGGKLFEELTSRNIGKPLAIFVGGELISAPNVNEAIAGGSAQITFGTKNYVQAKKEAIALARDLNAGAIPAPIELAGEVKVEASLGKDALSLSINAGIVGLVILSVWMIFVYRLLGLLAIFSLIIYAVMLIFILKFTSTFVLTLAGIAGIILSIGMAVDANILIFERMREEFKDGKNFSSVLSLGFERAFSSIKDSNISSLITCAILYVFGTSIVKGFAVMLALGIIISMFTAITITKTFIAGFVGTKISKKTKFFANVE